MKRWVLSVNGERLFVKGSNQGPTRMALAEATPARAGGRRAPGQGGGPRPAAGPRPRDARPSSTTPPTRRACCCGRTCPCSGDTPGASASRPPARRARPSTCSATTRRSPCGAATTSRSPLDPEQGIRLGRLRGLDGAADVEQDRARPLGEPGAGDGRPHPARRRPLRRAGRASARAAPTPTSTSAGTTATSATCPGFLAAWPAVRPLRVGVRRAGGARSATSSWSPARWPDLDWDRLRRTHALQKSIFDRFVPPADFADASTSGGRPPSTTRPR